MSSVRSGKQSSVRRASRFTPAAIKSNDEQEGAPDAEEISVRQMSIYSKSQRGEKSEAVQGSAMGRYTGVVTEQGEEMESLD